MQTESATGSTSSNKVRTTLTIQVETTDFDIQACVLRVKGRNVEENQYVKVLRVFIFIFSLIFLGSWKIFLILDLRITLQFFFIVYLQNDCWIGFIFFSLGALV